MLVRKLIFLAAVLLHGTASAGTAKPFAVVGDTQKTLLFEHLVLGREQNTPERFENIGAVLPVAPAFLIHLGDMVATGSSSTEWTQFDELTAPLKQAHIPIYPVRGNHEYLGLNLKKAAENVDSRFPILAQSNWYFKTYEGLGLIFLNSNQNRLSKSDWKNQVEGYKNQLRAFDSDPKIRGVLIFAHHPAASNSKVSGDDPYVRQDFLPPLLKARKTLAYISGHAHGYEHFLENGKHLIVSAGGGGPRVDYFTGSDAKHVDLFQGPAPRPFHFLLIQPLSNQITVSVHGFQKGEASHLIDQFSIPFAP